MSLAALSLAALPAATGIATQVAQAGQRVGSGFLNALAQIATPQADQQNEALLTPAVDPAAGIDSTRRAGSTLSNKTQAWCQRFMSWLNQRQPTGDLDIQLSLDSLDGPHVTVAGEGAESINSAIANDPTWLQEFRELALDRVAEHGPGWPAAPGATSPTLKLTRQNGQMQAAWS